jgi:hypothetical protein
VGLLDEPMGWRLEGAIQDWSEPIFAPVLPFRGDLIEAHLRLEIQIGPLGLGSTIFELYKDGKNWKGDTILLLNRGGRGALSASHTLLGPESEPIRDALPLAPGDIIIVGAHLRDDVWQISADAADGRALARISMISPHVAVRSLLGIQLGSHGDDSHRTNAGCRLLDFSATFS